MVSLCVVPCLFLHACPAVSKPQPGASTAAVIRQRSERASPSDYFFLRSGPGSRIKPETPNIQPSTWVTVRSDAVKTGLQKGREAAVVIGPLKPGSDAVGVVLVTGAVLGCKAGAP
jgi:hypothetical protein